MPSLRRYSPTKLCDMRRWPIVASFLRPVYSASRVQHISNLHSKFALRPRRVSKYGRHPVCDRWDYARKKKKKDRKKQDENIMSASATQSGHNKRIYNSVSHVFGSLAVSHLNLTLTIRPAVCIETDFRVTITANPKNAWSTIKIHLKHTRLKVVHVQACFPSASQVWVNQWTSRLSQSSWPWRPNIDLSLIEVSDIL